MRRTTVRCEFTITKSATSGAFFSGAKSTSDTDALKKILQKGKIKQITARMLTTESTTTMTNAVVWSFYGTTFAAAPDDLEVVYESAVVASPSESATDAFLRDDLGEGGAPFDRGASDHLGFGFSGTAGGTGDIAVSFSVLVENEVN